MNTVLKAIGVVLAIGIALVVLTTYTSDSRKARTNVSQQPAQNAVATSGAGSATDTRSYNAATYTPAQTHQHTPGYSDPHASW